MLIEAELKDRSEVSLAALLPGARIEAQVAVELFGDVADIVF